MDSNRLKFIAALACAFAVVFLLILQVATAENATKTETALFATLQFVFSIAVSWILTVLSSEKSFRESQKKFAIAAFRRIKEIERALGRAQRLVLSQKGQGAISNSSSAQAVMISLISAQDAVNSSVADWGDVIGDEIHITKEIEKLRSLRKTSDKFERDYLDNLRITEDVTDISPKINELKDALPPSLKLDEDAEDETRFERAIEVLDNELQKKNALELEGFWESDDTFAADLRGLKKGETLYLARGFTSGRPNSLLAYTKENKWIAVITNIFIDHEVNIGYDEFVDILESHLSLDLTPPQFGGKPVPVVIKDLRFIKYDDGEERQYVTVVLHQSTLPNAKH
ncbi:hypothetical protein CLU88_1895 [Acidovorax sp. 56]|uniref:hypothetical protein n=1 Tax=Acidovorax sp. 56 TaxID=2035205 RepID=UPI000C17130A|nr:hypothetical protein [Acidovorax sp. 56]PIF27012.1 hypothetical protein CLU88_1895 [Acidovorax sp. 56]